jgi:type I restriction enzyme S subunit
MSLNLDRSRWKRVTFGDVATASKERCDPTDGSVDRYIAGEHMDTDELKIRRWGDVGDGYLGPAFHRAFHPGQVLYGSRRTYLRKVAVAEFDGVCANTTFVVESKDTKVLRSEFLPFVMTSEPFHAFAISESKGSVNPYVNWSDIARYEFDLPPLDDQKRIAALLWAVERHRNHTCLAASSTGRARGQLVDDLIWSTVESPQTLSNVLVACDYGTSERCVSEIGGPSTPVLRIPNVLGGQLSLEDMKYLPEERSDDDPCSVMPGDFLIVRTNGNPNYVARGSIVPQLDGTYLFASYLLRLRPIREVLLPEFLAAAWETPSMKRRLAPHIRSSAGNYNLSASALLKQEIPLPPLVRQQSVVARLSDATALSASIEQEVSTLVDLKCALAADIFGEAK